MQSLVIWLLLLGAAVITNIVCGVSSTPLESVPIYLGFLALSFAFFGLIYVLGHRVCRSWSRSRLLLILLLVGACLRIGPALAPTSLSDDVYRYAWDGELLLRGDNPYKHTPAELEHASRGFPNLYKSLNSEGFHSVYPPASQGFFAASVGVSKVLHLPPERALRLGFGLVDLVTIWLLFLLTIRLGARPFRVALYAWNPFVVWEVVGGGHTEALLLPFLVASVLAAVAVKPVRLGVALGLAALAKLTVLPMAPVLGWFLWRRRSAGAALLSAVVCVIIMVLGFAPFWFDGLVENLSTSFSLYYGYFVFNAPLFDLSRWALGYREGITPDVSSTIMPWFQVGLVASIIVAALLVRDRGRWLCAGLCAVGIAQVVFTPVFHPWYLLPVVLLAVTANAWSPLVLSCTVGLSYLAYHPGNDGRVPVAVMVVLFVPFVIALGLDCFRALLEPILKRRARRKFLAFAEFLREGGSLVDIGAGEGYVSAEACSNGHRPVLVDVVDHNRTDFPHRVYDGRTLPFDDVEHDAGLLAYVLHHCDEPDRVIAEAARVCRQVIVMESVYETALDRRLLTFLDHLANRFRGIPVEPLHFDTVEGWTRRFARAGLEVVGQKKLGWFVHKHVLFVLAQAHQEGQHVANRGAS